MVSIFRCLRSPLRQYNGPMRCAPLLLTMACLLVMGRGVYAQSAGPQRAERVQHASGVLEPVDQAVGDMDPLSRSQRRVDPGNAKFSDRARIYRLQNRAASMWGQLGVPAMEQMNAQQAYRYRYEAPGVRAWLRRPEYLVGNKTGGLALNQAPRKDGEYRELIPAGTVFDLIPDAPAAQRQTSPTPPSPWVDRRLSTQINTRIDGRIDNTPAAALGASTPTVLQHTNAPLHGSARALPMTPRPRFHHAPSSSTAEAPAVEPDADATAEDEASTSDTSNQPGR